MPKLGQKAYEQAAGFLRVPESKQVLDRTGVHPESYAAAEKLAGQIAGNAPIAVRASKQAINDGLQVDIDRAVVIEEKAFGSCFQSADQQEGMGAFLEKRKHEPFINK